MSTLVIIDMQDAFHSAKHYKVVEGVLRQIKLAKARKAGIVVVEYQEGGPTLDVIKEAVDGYTRKTVTRKPSDDGSREVMRAIRRKKFNAEKLRVCGVNIGYCVKDTILGLLEWPSVQIEVAKDACGPYNDANTEWQGYPEHERMLFV
jgi:nicotinamidase-related amidase